MVDIHWQDVFGLSMSPVEIIVRGTITYWFIFLLLRVVGRRDIGSIGMADLLVIVLIADAAQNSMAGDYKSVPDGLILIATLVFWSVFIDRVGYFSPTLRGWLEPRPLLIVKDGVMQRRAMRREYITVDELTSELRGHGIDDIQIVKRAFMEPDGTISVIKR